MKSDWNLDDIGGDNADAFPIAKRAQLRAQRRRKFLESPPIDVAVVGAVTNMSRPDERLAMHLFMARTAAAMAYLRCVYPELYVDPQQRRRERAGQSDLAYRGDRILAADAEFAGDFELVRRCGAHLTSSEVDRLIHNLGEWEIREERKLPFIFARPTSHVLTLLRC